eukprot:752305-Hanusia_phi.AAC.2
MLFEELTYPDLHLSSSLTCSSDSLRLFPSCHDSHHNAYWYLEGSDGILYRESPPHAGHKAKAPSFQSVSSDHNELMEVGKEMLAEGKKKKKHGLQHFAKWLVEEEGPKLASKALARERAKSKQALLEMMPRKRSSRVAEKEEREKLEEEERQRRAQEMELLRLEQEKKKKEREREIRLKERQEQIEQKVRDDEKARQHNEAERERR